MAPKKNTLRRQLAENFQEGDFALLPLHVEGCLVRNEQQENGDWLFTLQLSRIQSERSESSTAANCQAPVRKLFPVLWSVRADGEVEIVIQVSPRQRVQVLGLPARQKEALRTNLASLPAEEAASILKEFISNQPGSPQVTGHLENENTEKKPIIP